MQENTSKKQIIKEELRRTLWGSCWEHGFEWLREWLSPQLSEMCRHECHLHLYWMEMGPQLRKCSSEFLTLALKCKLKSGSFLFKRKRIDLWNSIWLLTGNITPSIDWIKWHHRNACSQLNYRNVKQHISMLPPPQQGGTLFHNSFGMWASLGRWDLAREPSHGRLISQHNHTASPPVQGKFIPQHLSPCVRGINTFTLGPIGTQNCSRPGSKHRLSPNISCYKPYSDMTGNEAKPLTFRSKRPSQLHGAVLNSGQHAQHCRAQLFVLLLNSKLWRKIPSFPPAHLLSNI